MSCLARPPYSTASSIWIIPSIFRWRQAVQLGGLGQADGRCCANCCPQEQCTRDLLATCSCDQNLADWPSADPNRQLNGLSPSENRGIIQMLLAVEYGGLATAHRARPEQPILHRSRRRHLLLRRGVCVRSFCREIRTAATGSFAAAPWRWLQARRLGGVRYLQCVPSLLTERGNLASNRQASFILGSYRLNKRRHISRVSVYTPFSLMLAKTQQLVKLLLRDGVELVIVAPRAPTVKPNITVQSFRRDHHISTNHSSSIEPASVTVR